MKIGKIRINMLKDESYKDSANAYANIGESIQAATIAYIYKCLNVKDEDIVKVSQCDIKEYSGEKIIFPLRLPLSKSDVDKYFPLPENIQPVFLSLHTHDDIFEGRKDLVAYFKKYEPIGCRDEITCNIFRKSGIEAYIMGCYTLCLPERNSNIMSSKTYLVDVSEELMEYIPEKLKENSKSLTHAVPFLEYPITCEEDERLVNLAEAYMDEYREEATLIITSRLHAAAPCMAMGIPVVLASNNVDFRYAWIDKFTECYQLEDYSHINWNVSKVDVSEARELLMKFFEYALKNGKPCKSALVELDKLYRNRKKTEYYKSFKKELKKIEINLENTKFNYMIWGAGAHALFAYELMSEMYPRATLCAVIDKYKTGVMFGKIPIIKQEDICNYEFEHICITTNPGKYEALDECKKLWGECAEKHYSLVLSQQKS